MTALSSYFDTSALVKLYLREAFSDSTGKLFCACSVVCSHEIAHVETRAALAAARRANRLSDDEHTTSVRNFKQDWHLGISSLASDDALIEHAAELAEGLGLRGYDAVHLASAARVRGQVRELCFVSFDRSLNRAAKLLGLSLPEFTPLD